MKSHSKPLNSSTVINIIPKQSHRMNFIETKKMSFNDLFYNVGCIIEMWIGWSVISFSSFPFLLARIWNKRFKLITSKIKNLSGNLNLLKNIVMLKILNLILMIQYITLCTCKEIIFLAKKMILFLLKIIKFILELCFQIYSILKTLMYKITDVFEEIDNYLSNNF